MALNDKKLQRLDQLLAAFDTGAVQPDELIKAIDAVIAIVDANSKTLVDTIVKNKAASESDVDKLRSDLKQAKTNLERVISDVEMSSEANTDRVRASLLMEIKRVESLIPELPPETDLSEVFEQFEEQREELTRLGVLVVGENIRNALESLSGEDRLDVSAIKGIDELLEQVKATKVTSAAGVRLLRYLADVDIDGIADGQILVWDEVTGTFIPGSASGSSTFLDLTDTPSSYVGQAGKVPVVNVGETALEFVAPTGTGTVTSVAVSGSDGIEVDSGSPITAAGTIALGVNKSALLTHINVADGAQVNAIDTVTDTAEIDLAITAKALSATIVAGSIDETKLDASVNASLDLADSASQPGHTHVMSDVTDITAAARTVLDDTTVADMVNTLGGASSTGTGGLVRTGSPALVTPSIAAITVSGGILTLPTGATTNLVSRTSTDTLTNKTLTSPNINEAVALTATATELNILDGATLSTTELNYVDGVTSAIQGQLDAKASLTGTETLTNKRITKRVGTTTSSATPTINTDTVDAYHLTAQTADITSFTTNLSGTPTDFQQLRISVTGTAARAITWGASFENGPVALPTTTVTTTRLDVLLEYSTVSSKWRCMASGSTV